jgi:hypothetical protein
MEPNRMKHTKEFLQLIDEALIETTDLEAFAAKLKQAITKAALRETTTKREFDHVCKALE